MNKKAVFIIAVCVTLCAAVLAGTGVGIFYGITAVNSTCFLDEENLAKGAAYVSPEGKESSFLNLKGEGEAEKTVNFGKEVTLNTIVLYENGTRVRGFEIWADGNLIHKQEEIGKLRYCAVDPITTDKIIVKVTGSTGKFDVKKLEAFNIIRGEKDFSVTAYLTTDSAKRPDFDWGNVARCTDVIIFGSANYFIDGSIECDAETLSFVKAGVERAAGPEGVNIYLNFLLKTPPEEEIPEKMRPWEKVIGWGHDLAMGDNGDKLLKNIADYARENDYDGVDFDYEYPRTSKNWRIYSDFLVNFKAKNPDLLLSSALTIWSVNLSAKAYSALDAVQVMAYDDKDKFGNHSGFANCLRQPLEFYKRKGFDLKKVNMGIPFYARPTDMAAYWSEYKDEAALLGRFGTFVEKELDTYLNDDGLYDLIPKGYSGEIRKIGKRYFNGVQTVRDKAAFLYDIGAGGIMVWNYGCDVAYDDELSLFGAIEDVMQNR